MTQDVYCDEKKAKKKLFPRRRPKQKPFDWLEEPYNHVRGEKALWVAVITQAMMDALSQARNSEAIYHKHEAIRWLTENSKDFITVCLFAGFEPSYIRRKAKRAIVSPKPWRAEAGKGKRYLERKTYRQNLKNGLRSTNKSSSRKKEECSESGSVIQGPWDTRIAHVI